MNRDDLHVVLGEPNKRNYNKEVFKIRFDKFGEKKVKISCDEL